MAQLDMFVNRTMETSRFCELIQTGQRPIIIVWGKTGLGKTSLKEWMIRECVQRQFAKAEFVWEANRKYDPVGIMRAIRDEVGAEKFKPFTDLINYYTEPNYTLKIVVEGGQIAEGAQFTNTKLRDMANVIIRDSMLVVPRQDIEVPPEERLNKLTDLFIPCLAETLKQKMLWLFFDASESMSPETHSWIWNELFKKMTEGVLPNVRAFLCVGRRPRPHQETLSYVEDLTLQPFERKYVAEYLVKKGIDERFGVTESRREGMVDIIMLESAGHPGQVAKIADGLIKMLERERRLNRDR